MKEADENEGQRAGGRSYLKFTSATEQTPLEPRQTARLQVLPYPHSI